MAVIVIGGSGKDVGKTALVCAIIAALREYEWTAVKISGHDYMAHTGGRVSASPAIYEETTAGSETDTSRYVAAGARRALLITRSGMEVPVEEIGRAVGVDRNVIYESNRIVDAIEADVCLALVAGRRAEWKPSFVRFLPKADALVSFEAVETEAAKLRVEIPRFAWRSPDRLTQELVDWLRSRLGRSEMRGG